MPPLLYQIAGGVFFLPGAGFLVIAVVLGLCSRRRWVSILKMVLAVLGIAMIAVSAAALPWWLYGFWTIAVVGWISDGWTGKHVQKMIRVVLLSITITAAGIEISYQQLRRLPPGDYSTLYVVGDSISAGLDRPGEKTWPKLLRDDRHVQIVDLSRAGCTTPQALRIVRNHPLENGVFVIEIGGNDLIGKTDPKQFGSYLDQLIRDVQDSNRSVVMFELPLFPFDNAYGIEQRNVARRYGVYLIPRRLMAAILAAPGTTTDGIHFSNAGQRLLADLVWDVVDRAMETNATTRAR